MEKKEVESPVHWKSLWRAQALQLSMGLALLVPLEGCIDRHGCARQPPTQEPWKTAWWEMEAQANFPG